MGPWADDLRVVWPAREPEQEAIAGEDAVEEPEAMQGLDHDAVLLVDRPRGHRDDDAHGRDERAVVPERTAKSIGQERTFTENLTDREAIESILLGEVE